MTRHASPRDARVILATVAIGALVAFAVSVLFLRFNAPPGELGADAWKMVYLGDLIAYYLPMTELAATRMRGLELPLWNPHVCSGVPLLATLQVGAFYPGNWLALVLPAHLAISTLMALECVGAGWLATWMFRAQGSSAVAAAIGGLLYVFACVMGQVLWPPAVSTLLFVPWLTLCVVKLVSAPPDARPPARWWCGLAIGAALQIFAGFPQYAVYGYLAVACFGSATAVERLRAGTPASQVVVRAGVCVAAVLVGGGLAAVQLLPTLELVSLGMRADEMTAAQVHYLTILSPYGTAALLRNAFDPSPSLITLHIGNAGGYLGMATLLLAGLAVVLGRRSPRTWLLVGFAVVTLLLSGGLLGIGAPLYRVFAELPVVGSFRTPERLRVVFFLCVIGLAVGGFDAVRRAGAQTGARTGARTGEWVALAAVTGGLFAVLLVVGHVADSWRLVVAAGLVAALLRAAPTRTVVRGAAEIALFALVLVDVALATGEYGSLRAIPVELSNHYASPGGRVQLRDGFFEGQRDELGPARLELYKLRPTMATAPANGGYRVACYEPLVPGVWPRLEKVLSGRDGRGATLFALDPDDHETFWDLSGVRRILKAEGPKPVVVHNDDALPRAYRVRGWQLADPERAFRHIRDGDFDFRVAALLDEDPGFASVAGPLEPAQIVSYEAERVVVESEGDGDGLLVLTDSYYPGWRAFVDGEPARILRANGLHRGVRLPPGRHRVVFEYAPSSLRRGAVVSLASAILLAAVGLFLGFGRPPRRTNPRNTR